jgi:muramoyltetrapeptide carboxypeptidase
MTAATPASPTPADLSAPRFPVTPKLPLRCVILALSGSLDPDAVATAASRLRDLGHDVTIPASVLGVWQYFAGTDDERLAALGDVLAGDAEVVLFARGGYGLSRILDRIDWQAVAASKKLFCGYSDVTAFSLAALAKSHCVTYAGPVLSGIIPQDPRDQADQFAYDNFLAAITNRSHHYGAMKNDVALPSASIEGTLWGTNLAMISHLVGTPFMPHIDDGILVLEDIAESPYRVERMLWQLKLAGILDRQRAIILGEFTDCEPSPNLRYPYSMAEVLETLRSIVRCPVLTGFPFGHVPRKVTLPIGGRARLAVAGQDYELSLIASRTQGRAPVR